MKTTSQFASIAAAAAAGALFMYYVDAKRRQPGRATPLDRADSMAQHAPEVVEHPTPPARAAWNEQGV